jgi:hypothetical protein
MVKSLKENSKNCLTFTEFQLLMAEPTTYKLKDQLRKPMTFLKIGSGPVKLRTVIPRNGSGFFLILREL